MNTVDSLDRSSTPSQHTTGQPEAVTPRRPEAFEKVYAVIRDRLMEVEQRLQAELVSRHAPVNQLLQHGIRLGGKRLRPALLLLSARAVGRVTDNHVLLATVLEMIHTATLIHDDVLDEAHLRRHHDTINAKAGNQASVLLGDFLFSHAFYLASTLDGTFACRRIGRSTNIVCEGEMRQIHACGDFELDEATYLEMIDAKTAELCACCCELGAHYAGAGSAVQRELRAFGRNLGIAFQIVDDLLDVTGDEGRVGKSLGTDFSQQKLTLPTIRLLARANGNQADQLRSLAGLPGPQRRRVLHDQLTGTGAIQYARDRAEQYAAAARQNLAALPDGPARDALVQLTELVVERQM